MTLGLYQRARWALWRGMFINFNLDPSLMPFEMRRRAWMHAREEARAAYRAWDEAEDADRPAAYVVYRAAEEREAAAARAFGVS
jgi:hypothetical protein